MRLSTHASERRPLRVTFAVAAVCLFSTVAAAVAGEPTDFELLLEGLSAGSEADVEETLDGLEALLMELAAFRENPIDVNSATVADLMRIPLMEPDAAGRIVSVRDSLGEYDRLADLTRTGALDEVELARLRPYLRAESAVVVAADAALFRDASEGSVGRGGAAWSLRLRAGADEGALDEGASGLGERASTFARLRASWPSGVSIGACAERDPGERSLLDHSAVYLGWRLDEWRAGSARVSAAAGDLRLRWGQGLAVSSAGITSALLFPVRWDAVRGHDGAGESSARRGVWAGVSLGAARLQAVSFSTGLDATLNEDGLVSALREGGVHETESEIAAAEALGERVVGARVSWEEPGLTLSASALGFEFEPAFAPGDEERQRFRFSGSALRLVSADGLLTWSGVTFGAEAVRASTGGSAFVASLVARRGRAAIRAGAGCLTREYWSPLGSGLPGASGGQNARAAWLRGQYRPAAGWDVWTEVRATSRPWRSYRLELPDSSWTVSSGLGGRLGPLGSFTLEARRKRSDVESDEGVLDREAGRLRAQIKTAGSPSLVLVAVAASSAVDGVEEGALSAWGLRTALNAGPSRVVHAGVFTSSVRGSPGCHCMYEPRLPGRFGLASLNTPGARWYILLHAGFAGRLALSARLAGGPGREGIETGVSIDVAGRPAAG